jgi:hypothetical protein
MDDLWMQLQVSLSHAHISGKKNKKNIDAISQLRNLTAV